MAQSHPLPRARSNGVLQPLPARRKWRAITVATVVAAPACWALLIGLVSSASGSTADPRAANPAPAIAFGLALVPFVFVVLAFLSEHLAAPGAVVKAMGLCLLVGIPVSAFAADGVTGLVAGIGAGGVVALRADEVHTWKLRACGVLVASFYAFVLARTAGALVLVFAPAFPFTAIGIADHVAERRAARAGAPAARRAHVQGGRV